MKKQKSEKSFLLLLWAFPLSIQPRNCSSAYTRHNREEMPRGIICHVASKPTKSKATETTENLPILNSKALRPLLESL